jgi:hypothetical protein
MVLQNPTIIYTHPVHSEIEGYILMIKDLSYVNMAGFFIDSLAFMTSYRNFHSDYISSVRQPDVATLVAL